MWWSSMSVFQQIAFIIACAATFILLIQIVLLLVGDVDSDIDGISDAGDVGDIGDIGDVGDVSDATDATDALDAVGDADVDVPGSAARFGFRLFSFRSIVAFFAVGGWVLYTCGYGLAWYYSLIIAIVCGAAAACGLAAALTGIEKLQQNGVIDTQNTIGKIGLVYLTIPANRSGKGKINVTVQERYAEFEAVTDCAYPIPNNAEVRIIGHAPDNVLVVEPAEKPAEVEYVPPASSADKASS